MECLSASLAQCFWRQLRRTSKPSASVRRSRSEKMAGARRSPRIISSGGILMGCSATGPCSWFGSVIIGSKDPTNGLPEGMPPQHARPIRSETRATLVAAIARGRRWLDQLTIDASINTDRIAEREGCSVRKVNMTISLAFLAPDLVKAAIDGRLPYGMGIAHLTDLPAEWSKQREMLGFPSH
jgi:hypothetical protein